MLESFLFLGVGILLLFKSSDYLVESASRLAEMFGVSELVIGLTIVAVGTSVPEIASSVLAAMQGSPELALGNIIGSNISNIALVLGVSALISTVRVQGDVVKRDAQMLLASSILLLVVLFNGLVSSVEGALLLLLFVAYSAFVLKKKEKLKQYGFNEFVHYFIKMHYVRDVTEKSAGFLHSFFSGKGRRHAVELREFAIIFGSIVVVVFSANLFVTGAIGIAEAFNVGESFIGLTVVAIGTSVPELSVSLSAAKKGKGNLMVGNIVGSNISNTLLVLGLAAFAGPLSFSGEVLSGFIYNAIFLVVFSAFFVLTVLARKKIDKQEGIMLLAGYALFLFLAY